MLKHVRTLGLYIFDYCIFVCSRRLAPSPDSSRILKTSQDSSLHGIPWSNPHGNRRHVSGEMVRDKADLHSSDTAVFWSKGYENDLNRCVIEQSMYHINGLGIQNCSVFGNDPPCQWKSMAQLSFCSVVGSPGLFVFLLFLNTDRYTVDREGQCSICPVGRNRPKSRYVYDWICSDPS